MAIQGSDIISFVTGGVLEHVSDPLSADDYPSIETTPEADDFTEQAAYDPTLRTEFENGAVQTRARFTVSPKKWHILYRHLSDSEKNTIESFERTVSYGAGAFNWSHPRSGSSYTVRFDGPILFKIEPKNPRLWQASFDLVEAYPSSEVSE